MKFSLSLSQTVSGGLTNVEPVGRYNVALLSLSEVHGQPKRYLGLHGGVEWSHLSLERGERGG